MAEIAIRKVRFDDGAVRALLAEWDAELGFSPKGGSDIGPSDFAPPQGAFLVATATGRPVGCGGLRPLTPSVGELKRLFVSQPERGRGIGRRLLGALEHEARGRGLRELRLETPSPKLSGMATARATALLVAAALLSSGCEDDGKPVPPLTANPAATPAKQRTATTVAERPPATGQWDRDRPKLRRKYGPGYVPSAYHAHRPAGYTYPDEVGENVSIAPYRRVIEVFGSPASRRGKCIRYRIVRSPRERWEFCFKGQKMTSAMVVRPHG